MPAFRTTPSLGHQCLAWLLLVAVACMGLTTARQQALGSLHSHADQGPRLASALSATVTSLGQDWVRRWQQQHDLGHGQFGLATAVDSTLWPSDSAAAANATRAHAADAHSHTTLERHHHAAHDASVVALDGAAERADKADSPASGAAQPLGGMADAETALVVHALASVRASWPASQFVAMATRSVQPLLRPPSA